MNKDYNKPTKKLPNSCSSGWYGLTKAGYAACKKCGAVRFQTCKAKNSNHKGE